MYSIDEQGSNHTELKRALQKIAEKYPNLPLCLTGNHGNPKAPISEGWQNSPLTPSEAIKALDGFKFKLATGFGLLMGRPFDHAGETVAALAMDCDGSPAETLLKEMFPPLPETVSFTSGRDGRHEEIYLVSEGDFSLVRPKQIDTGERDEENKPIKLDFRWKGQQSILPPSKHPTTDGYRWINDINTAPIAPLPREVFKVFESAPTKIETHSRTVARSGEKYRQMDDRDWAMSYLAAIDVSALDWYAYRDLLFAVHSIGFSEDEAIAVSRTSSKHTDRGFFDIWRHIKSGEGIGIGTLGYLAKSHGWESPFPKRGERPAIGNVVRHPAHKPIATEDLAGSVDRAIDAGLTGSKLEIEFNRIARETGVNTQEIRRIYERRLEEVDREFDRDDNAAELEKILSARNIEIDLEKVLPRSIAKPLIHQARVLNLAGEAYLTALLAGCSSLSHPDTALLLYPQTNWKVPAGLYTAIVGDSGSGKSIIARSVITESMKSLHERDDLEYRQRSQQFIRDTARYEELKKEKDVSRLIEEFPHGAPIKPVPRVRHFSNATGEGIARYAVSHPDKGMMLLKDELAGLFKSANQYRSGRGSDSEDLLEYYDGTPPISLRADMDRSVLARKILLSIYGTVQPGVLQKLLGDGEDSNGQWARFVFCQLPATSRELSIDAPTIDITEPIATLYEKLDSQPARFFRLDRPAMESFLMAEKILNDRAIAETRPAMKNVLKKAPELIGRLALNLHNIHYLAQGGTPPDEVSKPIVTMARRIAHFYISQVESMYATLDPNAGLAPHLARILAVATDWITPNEARKRAFSGKIRNEFTVARVAELFRELETMGYGEVRKSARSIEFLAKGDTFSRKVIKGDKGVIKGDKVITPVEPISDKGFELKGDKGDIFSPLENISTDLEVEAKTQNQSSENTLENLSPLSPLSPFAGQTLTESGFTKGDKKGDKGDEVITFREKPPIEPGDLAMYRGRSYTVVSVEGNTAMIRDWREDNAEPFAVPRSEIDTDERSPRRRAGKGGEA
jgi:hypothetical protein